jgi:hypothetical protein
MENTVNEPTEPDNAGSSEDEDRLTLLQLIGSALAAGLGVQSSKNRKRDFSKGRPGQFIAIGVIFTALFVLIMIGVVNLVLNAVGAK